jgi:hypothetical protein
MRVITLRESGAASVINGVVDPCTDRIAIAVAVDIAAAHIAVAVAAVSYREQPDNHSAARTKVKGIA